ncbi:hypothetical protein BDQ17DRAFT_674894 [Cyathus striatus]|nr:hypothetical protein BDQ17DRAFT_674894 [Cyathus striatus]
MFNASLWNYEQLHDSTVDLQRFKSIKYIYLGLLTLLFYDHLITFDVEVVRIWTLNWRVPKYLFIMNRYVIPLILLYYFILRNDLHYLIIVS